ncbi:MAG: type I-B CRISPR-associated protein Cas7/Cst2/DevR [Acidobacteria bacterium]|jgi:CRISPR-associated protein Cst2|nr:type I-B CRISPR-associated protein Cas7/Cst2/DevR [Acidobacteriota bacterium]
MKSKGLTLTVVFEAESANYGEGIGNVTSLKKISRGNGQSFSYISRQALRYNIVNQMVGMSGQYKLTPVRHEGTIQFHPDASLKDYFEIDLFGYMKTKAKEGAATRSAVARLSNAVSLETFNGDLDFLTNKGLFDRLNEQDKIKAGAGSNKNDEAESIKGGNIAQSEIHKSFYTYTLAIDLDKVGVDGNGDYKIEIPNTEKYNRISLLLKALKFLYRDIKGRRENMSPMFIIGGVYDIKNPFFMNIIKLHDHKLEVNRIKHTLDKDAVISENTIIGYVENTFANDHEITELKPVSIRSFFEDIDKKVAAYYNG